MMIRSEDENTWVELTGITVLRTSELPACCQHQATSSAGASFECRSCGAVWLGEDEDQ